MEIVCRHPLEQGGIENQDFKNVLPWEPLQLLQLPQRGSTEARNPESRNGNGNRNRNGNGNGIRNQILMIEN